ncbi:MAG: Clp protease ClpP [Pseudomonadota bacterium]
MTDYSTAPQGQADEMPAELFQGLTRYDRRSEIRQISYYLSGSILQSSYYNELFYTLRTGTENDLIYLHLNTSGGDFDTGLQIINNMMASSAHVVAVLEARAYSMGAFIFLAADEMVVHDHCQLLFHSYSGVFAGKGNEQQAQGLALASWFEKFMEGICHPFLTLNEIKGILKGADLWMDSDEIRHRMARMQRTQDKVVSPHQGRHAAVGRVEQPPPRGAIAP